MGKYQTVLQLNQNYLPTDVVSWRQAVNLVIGRDKAKVLEEYPITMDFKPAVICLTTWSPDPYAMLERRRFSKRNIFIRDRYQCQYCSKHCTAKDITVDHVVPRSAGGRTEYLNCVSSCKRCNSLKGSLSVEKSGMRLLKKVRKPSVHDKFHMTNTPEEWGPYLGFVNNS